jgi:CRP-like cAMP-binding protein
VQATQRRAAAPNRLLRALPESELHETLAACEPAQLSFGAVLYTPGERLSHVYFPTSGFIALIMPIDGTASLEVGLVGNEGMFGMPLVLGVDASPLGAVVLGAGSALRMDAARFRRALRRSQVLQREMGRYVCVLLSQLAQAAACTRFHVVEARLARWLLMTQDRAHSNAFHVTQELLASMLGVRRVGVTKAASSLQDRGLIHYSRGNITIADRRGLKAASCGCYRADRDSYDRILGLPCGEVAGLTSLADDEHLATCKDGGRCDVDVEAQGRAIVAKE